MADGFVQDRDKRKNHSDERVQTLLHVPRYGDVLEDDADDSDVGEASTQPSTSNIRTHLVTSRAAWRRELAKWQQEQLTDSDSDSDSGGDTLSGAGTRRPRSFKLPLPLAKLFGGQAKKPISTGKQRRRTYTQEALYMELLAAEEEDPDNIPDDGAREGSGDEYEP
ncbi:hypothetical protein QCA50_003573 [Cerrena zonata]|uniref:Uncharacterized protein n=1 Tax=Cerrena zonata TaxID=2478898 RepID=A0AAW0GMY1_9APHY